MTRRTSFHLPNSLRMGLLIAALVGLLIAALAWFQIERERRNDLEEMDRRAYVIAHQMAYPAQVALQLPDGEAATAFGTMLEGYRRLIGLAVYRTDGRLVAAGKGVADFATVLREAVGQTLAEGKDTVATRRTADAHLHLLVSVIRASDGQPRGALAVLHDLVGLDERATHRQALFGFWIRFIVLSPADPDRGRRLVAVAIGRSTGWRNGCGNYVPAMPSKRRRSDCPPRGWPAKATGWRHHSAPPARPIRRRRGRWCAPTTSGPATGCAPMWSIACGAVSCW
ncbi:MAG: hypothetical protein U1F59_11365 [Candidatus Competibacteraceae bacterium]